MEKTIIETKRLILREWQESDFEPFAALNADPKVMEYFPNILTTAESNSMALKIADKIKTSGYGLFAAELKTTQEFIGFIGLNYFDLPLPFAPCTEIGWRLKYSSWGYGYATEGATAALKYGFEIAKLKEIVSFTATTNLRSQKVMEKLHMVHDAKENFLHPKLPDNHPLQEHVLYRLSKEQWQKNSG